MGQSNFKIIADSADLKIEAFGSTLAELFKNSLIGMFTATKPCGPNLMYTIQEHNYAELKCHKFTSEHRIVIDSPNTETLLTDFLLTCIAYSKKYNEVYLDIKIKELSERELDAYIFGTPIVATCPIIGILYHDLEGDLLESEWQATLVFDQI